MPPKEKHTYEFFIEGEDGPELVGSIDDITLRLFGLPECVMPPLNMETSKDSLTFSFKITPKLAVFLITGRYPTNNWMKMHGLPMERRRVNANKPRKQGKDA